MSQSLSYRPDIDGLRAIAVLLVVLFHGNLGCPGGFVGVDVFFVISGYLITGIILKDQSLGTFRFADFWSRRVVRIIPAATCMVFATLVAGYGMLLPADYFDLAISAIYQQGMLANVYFWRSAGYFSGPADMMPLLHTWSLAVEEQFYLLYPWLLILLHRVGPTWRLAIVGLLTAGSFALSEFAVHRYPAAAFFLLPTRAWELLLGGMLWLLPPLRLWRYPVAANAIAATGLASIFAAAFSFNASTVFPGMRALMPCVGAALVIQSASAVPTVVSRLLSTPVMVLVGLASYSIYLWHWPATVFLRHCTSQHPPSTAMWAVLGAATAVAFVSWRFVEVPFRSRFRRSAQANWLRIGLGSCVLVVGFSALVAVRSGFPHRAPQLALKYHESRHAWGNNTTVPLEAVRSGKVPVFGDPNGHATCLIWGDSHAMAMVAGLEAACLHANVRGLQITYFGTAPIIDFYLSHGLGLREGAVEYSNAVVGLAKEQSVDLVILAAYWVRYAGNPLFADKLAATIEELERAGIEVAIVLDYATQDEDVPIMLARRAFRGVPTSGCGVPMSRYLEQNAAVNSAIRHVAQNDAIVLDPSPYLTDSKSVWRSEIDGTVMYVDDDHISKAGSLRLKPMFDPLLGQISQRAATRLRPATETAGRPSE